MAIAKEKTQSSTAAVIFAVFAAACVVGFLAFRGSDVGRLPQLVGNLGGGPLFGGEGLRDSLIGVLAAALIGVSWFGTGTFISRFIGGERGENHSHILELARNTAVGAAVWSLVWFLLGLLGMYSGAVAAIVVFVGVALAILSFSRIRQARHESRTPENATGLDRVLVGVIAIPLLLALVSALAPPTAKDTLLYHFAVPKAFVAQHGNAFIEGNIASFLALGTEMHTVWAMLLGGFISPRAAETAAGVTIFLFFPLLVMAVFGWAREAGISRRWSLIAAAITVTVPTAYHVASSSYIDLALALYVTLAIASLAAWWRNGDRASLVYIAIFLGAALSIKLTALFVFAAFGLIVLLRARDATASANADATDKTSLKDTASALADATDKTSSKDTASANADATDKTSAKDTASAHADADDKTSSKNTASANADGTDKSVSRSVGSIVAAGFGALILAGIIASPWYLRTWKATGSPVFPFYMSIWKGEAIGWDVERSNLFQAMNSQYGGADVNKLNYVTAPIRASIAAQPEQAENYDGVLGVAFLIGLPILVWAIWKFELSTEIKIAAGVAGVMYLFWLFSSEQLRYLLPILPALAIALAASAQKISEDLISLKSVWQYSFLTSMLVAILTTFAWFCQKAPVRVALGGESRDQYLARNVDYYPYYQALNSDTPADAKVWLINMRRDTYNIERPVFSDYLFEDWTLKKLVWEARNAQELKAKAASLGVQYILTRHDFLFDYDRSTLVDDKKPRAENEAKLRMARELVLDPARTIKSGEKFSLVKIY